MNKKLNTVLFVLGATIINLIVMGVLFLISFILLGLFVSPDSSYATFFLGLTFLVSIGGTFVIYQFAVKKLTARYNLEEHLDPVFWKKKER